MHYSNRFEVIVADSGPMESAENAVPVRLHFLPFLHFLCAQIKLHGGVRIRQRNRDTVFRNKGDLPWMRLGNQLENG